MSQLRTLPKPVPRRHILLPDIRDRDFLPAATAITETPPSPVRMALMFTICGFAVAALAWSWFGRIDVIATARGNVEPAGHVKVVQPVDTGKVVALLVGDGDAVKAGDVLVRLDAREAEADAQAAALATSAAEAEVRRREAAIAAVRAGRWDDVAEPAWPDAAPQATRRREANVLQGDLRELSSTLSNLGDQEAEKQAAVSQLSMSLEAQTRTAATLVERVAMRQTLVDRDAGTKASLIDATQTLRETEAQMAGDLGRREQAKAALASLRSERRRTIETFLSDQTRKLADALRTVDDKSAERDKARARLDRMTLRAPVDGTVQALTVTTPGQVVTGGQELMRLVPEGTPIELQAYVTNEDIGFVRPGQEAVVKVDSFPFTRFGTIPARVAAIAHDAIPADVANQSLGDTSRAGGSDSRAITPTAKPMTDLVFEARLKPDRTAVAVNGEDIPLTPGMTVTVEIKTGSRRILEYLFSPIVDVTSTAMRER